MPPMTAPSRLPEPRKRSICGAGWIRRIAIAIPKRTERREHSLDLLGATLLVEPSLAPVGRLAFWRWAVMCLGGAGTSRKHDTIDGAYTIDGRRAVATLAPSPPDGSGKMGRDPNDSAA